MTWLHRTRICAGDCIVWLWPKGTFDNVLSIWVQCDEVVGVGIGQFIIMVVMDAHTVYDWRLVLHSGVGVDEAESSVNEGVAIARGADERIIDENRYGSAATECEFDRELCSSGRGETQIHVRW